MAPSAVADIVKRLPFETVTVGVFRDESPRRVVEIAGQVGLRAVQLHGFESAEDSRWVAERLNWTIKAFPAGHRNIERFPEYGAQTLLVDGPAPGSGELFDWRLAEGVVDPGRLLVSGGLRPDNVGAAVAHLHPWGVDVATGVESSPGVKDPGKVRDFVLAAREAGRLVDEQRAADGLAADSMPVDLGERRATDLFDWQDDL
jgi:phosphoribosylanthranilate isomerase